MPWVEKRNNGTYRLVVDLKPDSQGKRVRKTKVVQTTSKRTADKELIKFVSELDIESASRSNKIKFSALYERWRDNFVLTDLEYKTQENYLHHSQKRILPIFKNFEIDSITPFQIIDFLQDQKSVKDPTIRAGNATKVYVYRVLKSIFAKATEWYGLKPNPMSDVPKPKDAAPRIINVYTEDESNTVFYRLQSASAQFRVLISTAFTTGMRRGELLGLEWTNINFDKGQIEIKQSIPAFKDSLPVIKRPKNKGSIRTVSVPPSILIELQEYKKLWDLLREENKDIWVNENYSFLFCHDNGMPFYPKTLSDQWRSFIKKQEIRYIRFHDIRHTSVTILINRGIHAKIISERIGHTKISTTMDVYGHVIKAADVAAAAMFDNVFTKEKQNATQGGNEGGN